MFFLCGLNQFMKMIFDILHFWKYSCVFFNFGKQIVSLCDRFVVVGICYVSELDSGNTIFVIFFSFHPINFILFPIHLSLFIYLISVI
jgi:hypothetical protein